MTKCESTRETLDWETVILKYVDIVDLEIFKLWNVHMGTITFHININSVPAFCKIKFVAAISYKKYFYNEYYMCDIIILYKLW